MVSSEAQEKVRNSSSKSGLARTGASIRAYFMDIKDFLASSSYFTSLSFLNITVICLTNSTKFGIKRLKEFILPKDD